MKAGNRFSLLEPFEQFIAAGGVGMVRSRAVMSQTFLFVLVAEQKSHCMIALMQFAVTEAGAKQGDLGLIIQLFVFLFAARQFLSHIFCSVMSR